MRVRDQEPEEGAALRPRGRGQEPDAAAARAAAAGRWDAVGRSGLLDLQRSTGNGRVGEVLAGDGDGPSPVHEVLRSGGGRPLEPEVRADMESRLGHDFGDVRVHDDARAHGSAVAVDAHAYTVGSDIVFRQGGYDPGSGQGRLTLAHELTHVVQQRQGPVAGTPTAGGISVSSPDDRFERQARETSQRALADPGPAGTPGDGAAPAVQRVPDGGPQPDGSAPVVQRQEQDGDEPAEELPAAREPAPRSEPEGAEDTEGAEEENAT